MVLKISRYDLIAAVIPGILFLWGASIFGEITNIPLTGGLANTAVLIALAYVFGLILQGISQGVTEKIILKAWDGFPSERWLLEDDQHFSGEYKTTINEMVERKYGIASKSNLSRKEQLKRNQEIFYLCYNAVDKEDLSERPAIYNAHYGLFRCLLTTFSILLMTNVALLLTGRVEGSYVFYSLSSLYFVGAVVSYFRMKKRSGDFVKAVYDLFITHHK